MQSIFALIGLEIFQLASCQGIEIHHCYLRSAVETNLRSQHPDAAIRVEHHLPNCIVPSGIVM